ncbi:MAG TPA: hypothetical protein VF041_14645 [Gemmatimonadaceae bacterium]
MPCFLCTTCGTQYAESPEPPPACRICDDARQYVPASGQHWTTLDALRRTHKNIVHRVDPALYGIGTTPDFAIGQRALLVRTPAGNVLWDCIALLDDAVIDIIQAFGGLGAIAISHPHYYTTMVEWARAFGAPVLLHEADREWVARPDPAIEHWSGETRELLPGLTLIRCGGHFPGGTVLHWADGADGRGAILSGDILQVVPDLKHVSFMWSYPNLVPLPAATVRRIADTVAPFAFDRIYGAWWGRHIERDAARAVRRSAERYVRAIGAEPD